MDKETERYPGELEQLRAIDQAARKYVDTLPASLPRQWYIGYPELTALKTALFDYKAANKPEVHLSSDLGRLLDSLSRRVTNLEECYVGGRGGVTDTLRQQAETVQAQGAAVVDPVQTTQPVCETLALYQRCSEVLGRPVALQDVAWLLDALVGLPPLRKHPC